VNYFDARQDKVTLKWHYTCRTGLEIWAVGKCDLDGGHETEDGARACYRAYLVENARLNVKLTNAVRCCFPECEKQTDRAATASHHTFAMCKEHLNARSLDVVFPQVGTITSA
jgi:hypothetical protein